MTRMADYADIACDHCCQWVPGTEESTAAQRVILRKQGWSTRYGVTKRLEDVCPFCNGSDLNYWFKQQLKG
jgi:hypothetical protein